MTTIEPERHSSLRLAELIGARHLGGERYLVALCDPEQPRREGIAVHPSLEPDDLRALAEAGLAALVTKPLDEEGTAALESAAEQADLTLLLVEDTRLALARLSRLFDTRPQPAEAGVHPTAVVHASARLGSDVRIGAGTVVSAGAVLGEGVVLGPSCHVGASVSIGAESVLYAGVVLYDGVTLGRRCRVHAGAVIGGDGFGYALGPQGAEKIHHLAGVEVGDDVEIGANACIDRGTLQPTRIGSRTKIDNLVQVGHNVSIGEDVVVIGLSGIGGSARIGDGAVLAGMVAVADGVTIGPGARLAARSGLTKDVPAGETWGGAPAQPFRRFVRELYLIGRLETIWRSVKGSRGGAKPAEESDADR